MCGIVQPHPRFLERRKANVFKLMREGAAKGLFFGVLRIEIRPAAE